MSNNAPASLEELGKEIEELVGQPIADLPQPDHFAWWHPEKNNGEGKAPGGYVTFKRGARHPWMPKLMVTAMFRDGEELRIYTLPAEELDPGQWGVRRYFLSKKDSGSFEVEDIPLGLFAQLIADEWTLVAEGVRSAERERNQIVAYLETFDGSAADAAGAVSENQHWLEPPEPKGPEAPPNGAAAQAASPSDPLPS